MFSEFSRAIVRLPCKNVVYGLSETEKKPDFLKLKREHSNYLHTLKNNRLNRDFLKPDESLRTAFS